MTMPHAAFVRRSTSARIVAGLLVALVASGAVAAPPTAPEGWQSAWQRRLHGWWQQARSAATAKPTRPMGISFVRPARDFIAPAEIERMPERIVLLIHGLDEPGYIWDDLKRPLLLAGHAVARFEYPNDDAIADSADLLARELMAIRGRGVRHVDIVAHSMGGLVSRDVLTRAEHYAGDGRGGDLFPAVDRLIMVGPPNHGSAFAPMRTMTELKERAYRIFTSDDGWLLDFGADGTGQAGVDLAPDSPFLTGLNDRPPPSHTRLTIVAGRLVPLAEEELDAVRRQLQEARDADATPDWLAGWLGQDPVGAVESWVDGLARGVGDGVVTVDSARWEAVADFTVVEASHLTLLVDPGRDGRLPPAIPIILDRLGPPGVAPE
jgi:hypothetical protein